MVHESRRPNPTTFVPGSPALELHPEARPAGGEPVITKHLPGSFTNTGLEEHLRRHGIEQVIVSGFMTQMCCDTTAREAAHRGFKVLLAADAMAAMPVKGPDGVVIPADQVHRTHLGSLNGFLATVTSWVVGFVVALIFALLSYLFYAVAVAIISGSLGYAIAVGLLTWIGLDMNFLVWLIGIVAAGAG